MTTQHTRAAATRRAKGKKSATGRGKPKASTLRERQAAQRALVEARRERAARNRRLWTVLAPIIVALLVVTTLVAVKLATGSGADSSKRGSAAAPAVIAAVTHVPASAFDAVGAGSQKALPTRIDGPPLTASGKPRVLYIGAEYCPFCAAERWAVITALSRFGTWHGLRYAYSAAAPEVYPDTATFTFHGASYTSDLLSFTGVETHTNRVQGNGYEPLDAVSPADMAIFRAHDSGGSTPFIDLGGKHVIVGATYDLGVLAGNTQAQIARALSDPSSEIATDVLAAANVITASLCESTGGRPSGVCSSPGVSAAAQVLP